MDRKIFTSLEKAISKDRLKHYSYIFPNSSEDELIQKYLLNMKLSKSLYLPLQNLEITFRNNIHNTLSNELQNNFWFEDDNFLDIRLIKKVQEAKNTIHKNKELTHGRIISELSFGFWTYLLAKQYEQKIWNKYIKKIMPNIPRRLATRKKLSERINTIRNLRNKVFHFDTIINIKNLADIHKQILEYIYWLNEDVYNLTLEFDEFENIYLNEEFIIKDKLNRIKGYK